MAQYEDLLCSQLQTSATPATPRSWFFPVRRGSSPRLDSFFYDFFTCTHIFPLGGVVADSGHNTIWTKP